MGILGLGAAGGAAAAETATTVAAAEAAKTAAMGAAAKGGALAAATKAFPVHPWTVGPTPESISQIAQEGIAEFSRKPDFWSKFGTKVKEAGSDFLEGAGEGIAGVAGALGNLPGPAMGSTGRSGAPVGPLAGVFQSGGLSALARAIAGRR